MSSNVVVVVVDLLVYLLFESQYSVTVRGPAKPPISCNSPAVFLANYNVLRFRGFDVSFSCAQSASRRGHQLPPHHPQSRESASRLLVYASRSASANQQLLIDHGRVPLLCDCKLSCDPVEQSILRSELSKYAHELSKTLHHVLWCLLFTCVAGASKRTRRTSSICICECGW